VGPGVRPLRGEDDRSTFRSGDASLDVFFAQYAGQHQFKAHASVTYVAKREGRIAGYATVTAACIDIVDLPPEDRLRYPYPAPVLSLARLATDERDRGQGIGGMLLAHVFVLAAKYGFKPRPVVTEVADAPTPLFLKIATIKKALSSA
jgi:GNAT superfamily N-acetyltransferase